MTLGQLLTLGVAEAAEGGGSEGPFGKIADAWNEGGWGMYPIAFFFVIGLAITVERAIVLFFGAAINKDGFLRGLKKHIYAGDLDKAINYVAGQKPTPLTNVIKSGLMNVPKGEEETQAALDEASLRETPRLEARSGYLAMLGNAAMLAGLLGTRFGLIAAIPLLIFFSVLNGRTQSLINDINETSVAVLNLIVQNKDKFKNMTVPANAEE